MAHAAPRTQKRTGSFGRLTQVLASVTATTAWAKADATVDLFLCRVGHELSGCRLDDITISRPFAPCQLTSWLSGGPDPTAPEVRQACS